MNPIHLLVCITERWLTQECEEILQKNGVHMILSTPAEGTASSAMLEYLGMDRTEKALLLAPITEAAARPVVKAFHKLHRLRSRNNGITAMIPMSSVGGATVMRYMVQDQNQEEKDLKPMEKQAAELIIAISNSGYTDEVMEAARSAGARGGTVVHAKTADMKYAEQFFGVSISTEKAMVMIISTPEDKHAIMQAIMEQAGVATKARSIVFSIPVSDVKGATLTDD